MYSQWAGVTCTRVQTCSCSSCPECHYVSEISLASSNLRGTLPAALSDLNLLRRLDLRDNVLTYPATDSARAIYNVATGMCTRSDTTCFGLPPLSCSAFGPGTYQLSMSDPMTCDLCPSDLAIPILVFSGSVCGALATVALYVVVIVRYPSALRRWVSTLTILAVQSQTIGILSDLGLETPASVQAAMGILSLNVLHIPRAACILGSGELSPFWFYATSVCGIAIVLLVGLAAGRSVAHRHGRLALADSCEFVLTVVYSVILTTLWRTIMKVLLSPRKGEGDSGGVGVPEAAFVLSIVLLLVLLLLFVHFARNVRAYCRGAEGGGWKLERISLRECRCRIVSARIAPRRLDKQVRYFTLRFAPHAPRWQFVIWLRQLMLYTMTVASDAIQLRAPSAVGIARYVVACIAALVLLASWGHHCRRQPYAFRFQNAIESWFFASNVLFLVVACAHTALTGAAEASKLVCEVVLMTTLIGGILIAALLVLRDGRTTRRWLAQLGEIELSSMLLTADAKIDEPLRERLEDGSIRLVRCHWLCSPGADDFLDRDEESGAVIMRRRQDLPPEAYFSPKEATALLDRGDRSVFALTYRWLTGLHPDPKGTTLAALRRFLQSDPTNLECGIFWDFASLPQKGRDGAERSKEDKAIFERSVKVMGLFYASITGTTVLQLKVIPPRPQEYDGYIVLFGNTKSEEELRRELGLCYGTVVEVSIPDTQVHVPCNGVVRAIIPPGMRPGMTLHVSYMGGVTSCTVPMGLGPGQYLDVLVPAAPLTISMKTRLEQYVQNLQSPKPSPGEAHVRFATHEQAEACVAGLQGQNRAVDYVYNTTAYDRASGYPYSGWCTFEQGAAKIAAAHLQAAREQAEAHGTLLPERLTRAQTRRVKIIDISGDVAQPSVVNAAPTELLAATIENINGAKFVGKGDKPMVQHMLSELDWIMKTAAEQATARHAAESGLTVDPLMLKHLRRIKMPHLSSVRSRRSAKYSAAASTPTSSPGAANTSAQIHARRSFRIIRSNNRKAQQSSAPVSSTLSTLSTDNAASARSRKVSDHI
jgi:hypothetical protein